MKKHSSLFISLINSHEEKKSSIDTRVQCYKFFPAKLENKLDKLYCLSLASPPAWYNAYMGGHNLLKYSTLTAFKCSLLWAVSWAIH